MFKSFKSITNSDEYLIRVYNQMDSTNMLEFYKMCLPESGRNFEPDSAHASLLHVEESLRFVGVI